MLISTGMYVVVVMKWLKIEVRFCGQGGTRRVTDTQSRIRIVAKWSECAGECRSAVKVPRRVNGLLVKHVSFPKRLYESLICLSWYALGFDMWREREGAETMRMER